MTPVIGPDRLKDRWRSRQSVKKNSPDITWGFHTELMSASHDSAVYIHSAWQSSTVLFLTTNQWMWWIRQCAFYTSWYIIWLYWNIVHLISTIIWLDLRERIQRILCFIGFILTTMLDVNSSHCEFMLIPIQMTFSTLFKYILNPCDQSVLCAKLSDRSYYLFTLHVILDMKANQLAPLIFRGTLTLFSLDIWFLIQYSDDRCDANIAFCL